MAEYIFGRLVERLGFTLVVAVAALATAVAVGNGIVAAIVGIGAGLVVSAFWRSGDGESQSPGPRQQRAPGSPFVFRFSWAVAERPDLKSVEGRMIRYGLKPDSRAVSGDGIALKGGSQLRTRLLGGYFVDPKHLPARAELTYDDRDESRLDLQVRDTIGVAVRDRALEVRYEKAAAGIRQEVESCLCRAVPVGDSSR